MNSVRGPDDLVLESITHWKDRLRKPLKVLALRMDLLTYDNLIIAERLRNDDPEQFYTLVKMHLSFVLDLNTDEGDCNADKKFKALRWNLPFSKKAKPYTKNCSEGSLLTSEFMEQIRHLINFLRSEDNIIQEGIFRRSGKVTRQQELKTLISQGVTINLNEGRFSVHECATVLKNILAELPESVLTDAQFPAYCQIAELCNVKNAHNEERLLKSLQLLILLLPSENRIFFQDIIALLHLAASHEHKNRMSADNLATLFTPHLLCPRKLSPEALHMNSQVMSRVVAFMIQKGTQLFEIPQALATDLQAYWNKKERRKLSPLKQMNESICDSTAANTVFTFVDRERTAQENGANPTETALAQLYAYIQSLPESSKKRKLIKQFNKENGHGTPLRVMGGKKRARSRSLGDSIKKHLPTFTRNPKRPVQPINYGEETCNTPVLQNQSKVKPTAEEILHDKSRESVPILKQPLLNTESLCVKNGKKKVSINIEGEELCENEENPSVWDSSKKSQKFVTYDTMASIGTITEVPGTKDSTEDDSSDKETSLNVLFNVKKRSFLSPVENTASSKLPNFTKNNAIIDQTRSEHHDNCHQWPVSKEIIPQIEKGRSKCGPISKKTCQKPEILVNSNNLDINIIMEPILNASHKTPCKTASVRSIDSEGFVEPTVFDNIKTPSRKFSSNSSLIRLTNNDFFMPSPNTTNRKPMRYCSKSHLLMTSTPAPRNGCIVTPIVDKNNSMSPITRSTQRMPKAMQETMMTPRSRKPVISLSGTDLCNLASMDSVADYPVNNAELPKSEKADFGKKLLFEECSITNASDSLSSTFRDYLFSRSVLTTSPVDLSFSSRTDDFLSLSDNNSSAENEEFKSLAGSILNEGALSESLLYCLDGNEPNSDNNSVITDEEPKVSDDGFSSTTCSESLGEMNHVYETAL